ncbi:MAG: hypothetical protein R3338_04640, partial [Thermoanaerobaculia bacterium]|nr:hypothetical protein [Thermoanaerobaculia bacterium]
MKRTSLIVPILLSFFIGCGGEQTNVAEVVGENPNEELSPPYRPDEPATANLTGVASRAGDVMPDYEAKDLEGGTWSLAEENGVT